MKKNDYKKDSGFLSAVPYILISLVLAFIVVIAVNV